jgi:hypothetical protein
MGLNMAQTITTLVDNAECHYARGRYRSSEVKQEKVNENKLNIPCSLPSLGNLC